MKKIALTQGKFALVDDEDYGELIKHKWYAHKDHGTYYANRRGSKTQKTIIMHRQILGLKKGEGPHVDHRNHNGLDNRRCNIWPCTNRENQMNSSVSNGGAYFHKNSRKWIARMKIKGKSIYLGCYKAKQDALLICEIARFCIT